MNRFQQAEENERAGASEGAKAAVYCDNELDPIIHTGPKDKTSEITEQEAVLGAPLAGKRHKQRRYCHGCKKSQVEARMNEDEENAAQDGEGAIQEHALAEARSLTMSAM
jgi:hypothetical protein